MIERGDSLATSTLVIGEVLAGHYARIRRDKTIRSPDAIQLACTASAGVDLFITNDDRLSRKNIPGIHFITSLARAPI